MRYWAKGWFDGKPQPADGLRTRSAKAWRLRLSNACIASRKTLPISTKPIKTPITKDCEGCTLLLAM